MTLASEMAADMVEINADWPYSVTWKGGTYQAILGEGTSSRSAELAGIFEGYVMPLYLTNSLWTAGLPKENDTITLPNAKIVRVVQRVDLPDGLTTLLQCEDVTK